MYFNSILDLIGNTPLVRINQLNPNPQVTLLAKLEYLNPGGSVKDRIGTSMIEKAEKEGKLKPGGTIVEPTSGNTGVGIAIAAALKGYKTVFVMPDKMSDEKRNLLRAYGSKVVITPTAVLADDERSYYRVSDRLASEIKGAYKPNQYQNPANTETHYKTTGPEIWNQTQGKITHFVCGMGTGGTITGVAKYLKEKNPNIKVVGVDPVGSIYYEYKKLGKFPKVMKTYKVEGVGEDFVPGTIDFKYIDEVTQVGDRESFLTTRKLARKEGILGGGSSGMAMYAAIEVCKKLKSGFVVTLFPDSGKSYLSKIFNNDWMRENGFLDNIGGISASEILKSKSGPNLISVNPENSVKDAIKKMRKYDISQIIVVENGKLVGKINEGQLLEGLYESSVGPSNKVRSVYDQNVQVVFASESIDRISQLLIKDNLVAVIDKAGNPMGAITRIDLITYYS